MSATSQNLTPNTKIQSSMLSENVVLCCGEDPTVVWEALKTTRLQKPLLEHDFRSYHLVKCESLTVILAAIGTGALEPLLFEILRFNVVQAIVLVGTAGRTLSSKTIMGQPYIIGEAYLEGTALDREVETLPLLPNYAFGGTHEVASIVSTDFYYAFSLSRKGDDYPGRLPRLQKSVREMVAKVDLVDMEVGQFYALCQLMSPKGKLKYLAIKGPANSLGYGEDQNIHAKEVIEKALGKAIDILGIRMLDSPGNWESSQGKVSSNTEKLTEEIKLYWTIQTAIVSVLGFLATSIDFSHPVKSSAVIVCAILLVGVGAIYNLVGNYYAYHEGERVQMRNQENVVTPSVMVIYAMLSVILGLLLGHLLVKAVIVNSPELDALVGQLLPSFLFVGMKQLVPAWLSPLIKVCMPLGTAISVFAALFYLMRYIYGELCKVGSLKYKCYSRRLQTMLRMSN